MSSSSSRSRNLIAFIALFLFAAALPDVSQAQYFRFGKNKVQYKTLEWFFVQSRHFDVYYYEPGGRYLAEFTAHAAEEAYSQISELFQHQISDRIPILVYLSHNDFAVTNAVDLPVEAEGIGGVTELFKNRVAMPFTGDYRDYRRVLHHELVHATINDMFYGGSIQSIIQNNISLHIPLWFNEGISEYSALGWDSRSDMWVRDAIISNYLAPIPYLSGYFAYRGGQSVWDYIAEQYGREKIGEVMQRLRLTRSVDGAFKRATGLNLQELSERWHKALKEQHWPEIAARENMADIATPVITREQGFYNMSPALSPQGDMLAFITTRSGYFDVFLASAVDGKIIRKLVSGQDNTQFESLKILTPGLTWSPDGKKVAIAVKSGPSDAIAVVDVRTTRAVHYRVPNIEAIISLSWSPDGQRIAFEGTTGSQSDIFVLDLETRQTLNVTNDVFSDHEPSWSPDGNYLVFHSDRGDYLEVGAHTTELFDMLSHNYNQHEVYRLKVGNGRLERLTYSNGWDSQSAKFGSDPERLLFVSDRNGVFNLYEKNLTTGAERPLTDLILGVMQVAISADGNRVAVVSLKEGTPSIYVMKSPFDRKLDKEELAPNVWAQRVMQNTAHPAPALALASSSLLQQNPFLRDATDGIPYAQKLSRRGAYMAARNGRVAETTQDNPEPAVDATEQDTTSYGGVRVDFRNYVFSEAFEKGVRDDTDGIASRFDPEDNLLEDGRLRPRRYKLSFSPDIIYGASGYDNLYGVQNITQMMFSDMLGNHQIYAATNFLTDLRNSDYFLSYAYMARRTDYSVFGYHIARLLPSYRDFTYYRYRYYGMGTSVSYPLDKFRRFDLDVSFLGINLTDIVNMNTVPETHSFLYPVATYTKDVTLPGYMHPMGGYRYAFSLAGTPGGINQERPVRFMTLLGDMRWYKALATHYSIGTRPAIDCS